MTTVAVTGSSGYLGRLLVEALDDEASVSRVVGIDVVEPGYASRKLETYVLDVRDEGLTEVLDGCDVVVHLAAIASGDPDEVRDVNVGGTRAVVAAAGSARRIVHASSIAAYGWHPDSDFPLTEASPLRASPEDTYASSKAEAEEIVDTYASGHPDTEVVILRLAWTCGPTIPGSHASVIESPIAMHIEGYDSLFQALHSEDAARALVHAATGGVTGTFNVCADDWIERPWEVVGQRLVSLDRSRARSLLDAAWRTGASFLKPSDLSKLMYPLVASNEAAKAAGFVFERSTADALREGVEARRGWVRLGRYRFRPRWAAVAAASLVALAYGARLRPRR